MCRKDRPRFVPHVECEVTPQGGTGAPVQTRCEMRATLPGTGSVDDMCVVRLARLLRVVVDVTIAPRMIGCAATASTGASSAKSVSGRRREATTYGGEWRGHSTWTGSSEAAVS